MTPQHQISNITILSDEYGGDVAYDLFLHHIFEIRIIADWILTDPHPYVPMAVLPNIILINSKGAIECNQFCESLQYLHNLFFPPVFNEL
jgi:hypothetical protein